MEYQPRQRTAFGIDEVNEAGIQAEAMSLGLGCLARRYFEPKYSRGYALINDFAVDAKMRPE